MNPSAFLEAVARCLPNGGEVLLAASHTDTITLEAAAAGPARQCGSFDELAIALRSRGAVSRVRMTGTPATYADARTTAEMLRSMLTPAPPGSPHWPVVRPGHSRDWTGEWAACVHKWEQHLGEVTRHLRRGEQATVSLERWAAEAHDSHGHRRDVLRHRAILRVVVPAPATWGVGWEMSVPSSVGACRGLLAALEVARAHARMQSAVSGPRALRDRDASPPARFRDRPLQGRVLLDPIAVAEALVRWRTSADASPATRPTLAAIAVDWAESKTGGGLEYLLDTVTSPSWSVPTGNAPRHSRGCSLLVRHVEAWLSGDDTESATAIVTGLLQPGGRTTSARLRIEWRRLEAAVKLASRRGSARQKLLLAGRDIHAPRLDLGVGQWLVMGRESQGNCG